MGWEDHAPYDRIMVTAAAPELFEELVGQLGPGGKMVIPVGSMASWQDLLLVEKDEEGRVSQEKFSKVRFVELIREE